MHSNAAVFGLLGVGADQRRKLHRQSRNPLNAFVLRAKLLVEDDVLELRQPLFQPDLQVGLVEELRVGEARTDHARIAGDDLTSAVGRLDVGNQDEASRKLGALTLPHSPLKTGVNALMLGRVGA